MRGRLINDRVIDDRLIHARPINDARQHLIVALDVSSAAAARKIVAAVGDSASTYKVGMQLHTAEGPQIVRELVTSGRRIFLDLKYHDIPRSEEHTSELQSRLHLVCRLLLEKKKTNTRRRDD